MTLTGNAQGLAGERRRGAVIAFVVLVCLAIWVTLDLNQPGRGTITVSQEPFERLLQSMEM